MATEIRVPTLGESVTEATVGLWFKKVGDTVAADEPLVELETDKVTLEVPAPSAGILSEIKVKNGAVVNVGAVLATIEANGAGAKVTPVPAKAAPAAAAKPDLKAATAKLVEEAKPKTAAKVEGTSPAAQKIMTERGVSPAAVSGTGKDGRITKGDAVAAPPQPATRPMLVPAPVAVRAPSPPDQAAREERVPMSRLRQTIARRLKEAQNTAAMLTTFNEVDMSAVMKLRTDYRDLFEKKHGVKLGFMGFFVKACVQALKEIPAVNGEIDGADIVYKNYYNLGIAVGTDKGLVVPVVRDADQKSLAEIEKNIADFGKRAGEGKLTIEELTGGTFSISNGGVFGSMLSTPFINPPQAAILGVHATKERPVVENGQIVIRPINYLALSYDHRLIDGREAVLSLVAMKDALEDPARMLLDL